MSCTHCSTKFNFFHKEMGCANCGLSFCNKCLKQKCKVPNKGSIDLHVCKTCYAKLNSGTSTTNTAIPPPDTFIKSDMSESLIPPFLLSSFLRRLENLENPSAPPITIYKEDKLHNLKSGLSPADQKLVERLENLKDGKSHLPPTEAELRKRLASLKGENNYVEGPSKQFYVPDTRTDAEKSDALLQQFISERDIELSHNPQGEIEARLASLREQGVRPNEGPYISNLHDSSSEEEADNIAKKIMDEVALEDKCSVNVPNRKLVSNSSNESEDPSLAELPWCVLCNKDAKVRCLDCGNDLYCSECNIEVHKNWGDTDHTVIPFKPK